MMEINVWYDNVAIEQYGYDAINSVTMGIELSVFLTNVSMDLYDIDVITNWNAYVLMKICL